jgi:hypothetical protein
MQLSPRQELNQLGHGLVVVGAAGDSRSDAAQEVDQRIAELQAAARQTPLWNGQDSRDRLRRGQAQGGAG